MVEYFLDCVFDFINGGAWSENEYADSGIHVVKVTNMVDGEIVRRSDDSYLPNSKYDKYKNHRLKKNDILIATVGSHPTQQGSVVGRTAFVLDKDVGSFLNQNAVCLRLKKSGLVDPVYFYYISKTILFKWYIESRAKGSANQVRMALGDLKKFKYDFPKFEIQQSIAAILFAYDDLIENNKRRIALLEKMAEEIYREWFVRFRFPGWQEAEFEKGIPKEWTVQKLSDLAYVNRSSLNKNVGYDEVEYVDIGSVTTNQINDTTIYPIIEAPGRARRKVKHGDVIWSSVRPANRAYALIFSPAKNLIVSTGFAVISPKDLHHYPFLFKATTMDSYVDQITAVAKGAAYPATSFEDFEKSKILTPDNELLEKYHQISNPIFEQISLLKEKNKSLAATKDALLPRLISGRLSVEELEVRFPPSMLDRT